MRGTPSGRGTTSGARGGVGGSSVSRGFSASSPSLPSSPAKSSPPTRSSVVVSGGSQTLSRGGPTTINTSPSTSSGAIRSSVVGGSVASRGGAVSATSSPHHGTTTTTRSSVVASSPGGAGGAVRSSVVGGTATGASVGGTGVSKSVVTTVVTGKSSAPPSSVSSSAIPLTTSGSSSGHSSPVVRSSVVSGGGGGQLTLSGGLASDVSAFLSSPPVKSKLPSSSSSSSDVEKLLALLRAGVDANMKGQILSFLLFAVVDQNNKAHAHKVPGLLSELSSLLTLEGAADQPRVREASQAFLILSATDDATRESIRSVGGVEKLGKLLTRSGNNAEVAAIKENAIKALVQLMPSSSTSSSSSYTSLLPAFVQILKDKTVPDATRRHALQLIHHTLPQPPFPPTFFSQGGVEAVIESLSSPALYDLSIVLLAKMTSASPELRKLIAEKGASAIISNIGIPSASSPQSVAAFRNSLVTLSNLCVDEANSDRIAHLGAQKIMELLRRCSASPKGTPEGDAVNLILQLLINISTTPKSVDSIVANDGLSLVLNLARDPAKTPTSPLADENVKSQIVSLLSGLLTNDEIHEKFIKESGVKLLVMLLTSQSSKTVKKEAAKGIANISQFYEEIREDVGKERGVFEELVRMLSLSSTSEDDVDSKRQSLRALTNLSLSYNNVNEMLKHNIVNVIKKILESSSSNTKPNRDMTFFTSKLLVNLTAHDQARPIVSKEIGVDMAINMLKDEDDSFQLQSLKLLTNLSIQGSNRKKLHEKGIVGQMKSAKLRSGETKQQTEVALANLSFPYEDKYDDNGVAVSTSPSSEGIVLPPLTAPFLLPHELLVDDDDDEEFTESSLQTPKYSPQPATVSQIAAKESPTASPVKSKATGSIYSASPKASPTPQPAAKVPPPRASTTSSPSTPSRIVPDKPLPPSPKQSTTPAVNPQPQSKSTQSGGLTEEQRSMHNHRTNIAKEILSTEMSYVGGLKQLIWKFFKPLSNSATTRKPMINQTELKTIFSNIEVIYNYNSVLLEGLENRLKNWSATQRIGDIFIKMTDYLRCYVEYVNNYQHALDLLNKLRKERPALHNFLRKQETSKECRSLPLDGFLITPVQRIPRYELLLRDLLKQTWTSHVDYQELTAALQKVKETNVFINEKKRESEGLEKLFAIDSKMVGNKNGSLFEASRRWIKDGSVLRVKKGPKLKQGWLHLFNDILILSSPKGRKKDKKFHWRMQVAVESLQMDKVAPSGKVTHALRFVDKNAKEMEFIVALNSEEEQLSWHRSVQELQKILHQRRISFRSPSVAHLKQ
eukprot:TRINITY_DN1665_c0_g6_i1.p1 TRINITY_DN1665_c0_g6~~TRINITY_DN1665_c0_g6_i1.p1  ORF type:complete len:1297 (+),score=336.71 TRINITY_DN1665_c0_g6_i1:314-4204(+)